MSAPSGKNTDQFIVPTGIDLGRVEKGLKYWFKLKKVPSILYFPVSKEWEDDPRYKTKVLNPLKTWLKKLPSMGFDVQVEFHPIENMDDFEQAFKYLMRKMKELRVADPASAIYIDTTSAPKTWLLAAMKVIDSFSMVVVYHTKSGLKPKDYPDEQIEDEGGETKVIGDNTEGIKVLVEIASGKGIRGYLFRELYQKTKGSQTPVLTRDFVDAARAAFPTMFKTENKDKDEEDVHRAVTGYFTDIMNDGKLVKVKGAGGRRHVTLTDQGVLTGMALYDETVPAASTSQNQS